jgi:hypothetical protein
MIKRKVGENADIIWNILIDKGALSVPELIEKTAFSAFDMRMALGWLSKEDKISFLEKDGTLYISPRTTPSEIYY